MSMTAGCGGCLQITVPSHADEVPELPEPEGSVLKNHLKQVQYSAAWLFSGF